MLVTQERNGTPIHRGRSVDASAMAATPEQSVAVAAPASDSASTTTEASSAQPDTTCYEEWYVDAYGNWYYVWVCE